MTFVFQLSSVEMTKESKMASVAFFLNQNDKKITPISQNGIIKVPYNSNETIAVDLPEPCQTSLPGAAAKSIHSKS